MPTFHSDAVWNYRQSMVSVMCVDAMFNDASVGRNVVVVAIAVVSGYLGSALHDLMKPRPTTVRAGRFEVTDPSGRLVSYWGPDVNPQIPAETPKGALLVFMDPHGVRRCQIGARVGDNGPELVFFGTDGPSAGPRVGISLGGSGSPTLHMRGNDGDRMALGAMYGDVFGEPELGWGLSFRAWAVSASAGIGYGRWWNGTYRSSVSLSDGTGKTWEPRLVTN